MKHEAHNIGTRTESKWAIKLNDETVSYCESKADADLLVKDLDAIHWLSSRGYKVTQWLSSKVDYPGI